MKDTQNETGRTNKQKEIQERHKNGEKINEGMKRIGDWGGGGGGPIEEANFVIRTATEKHVISHVGDQLAFWRGQTLSRSFLLYNASNPAAAPRKHS
jgi:hypothetical protein